MDGSAPASMVLMVAADGVARSAMPKCLPNESPRRVQRFRTDGLLGACVVLLVLCRDEGVFMMRSPEHTRKISLESVVSAFADSGSVGAPASAPAGAGAE